MREILLIDKPKGITSFDVIRKLRKELGIKKMGHGGTLDPLASGLMIIGVEKGTKKLNHYLKLDKVYEAEVLLGKQTTTGDLEGETTEVEKVEEVKEVEIQKVLDSMLGVQKLAVPKYSAIKVNGRLLYDYARKGEDVEIPIKEIEIKNIKLNDHYQDGDYYILDIELEVSSGSYIRSIAEEIGRRLDYPATLQNLRRTRIGDFDIKDAQKIE